MTTLLVKVEGRALRFDPDRLEAGRPVRVGRSIEADVVLTAGSVSRTHAELRPTDDGGWVLVDNGSQFGTFVGADRVREHRVSGPLTVQCGPDARGSSFEVVPEGHAGFEDLSPAARPVTPPPPPPPGAVPAPPTGQQPPPPSAPAGPGTPPPPPYTPAPAGPPPPPGARADTTQILAGPAGPGQGPGRSGPDLLVVAEDREYRFRHPAQVRVGRMPDCDIVVEDPVCSRLHAEIVAGPGGWRYVNHSGEGSFDEGRRVAAVDVDARLDLRLGHPVAGPQLSVVPILSAAEEERRFARKRRRRVLAMVGAAAAVLAVVAGGVVGTAVLVDEEPAASGTSGSGGTQAEDSMAELTSEELESAKAATVLLTAETENEIGMEGQYSGSGTILSEDGLILTNAHVASPESPGLEAYYGDPGIQNPEFLLVSLTSEDDAPTSPSYRARPVEVDGERDVAVLEIYADENGREIDTSQLDLPTIPIGNSDALESGDDVTVLGFPGISGSQRISVTTGVISTFIDRPDLGPRSEIDTDARIAPGNSGGAAINNDAEIIGIPSALFAPEGSPVVSGRIRPINFVEDVIEGAMAS